MKPGLVQRGLGCRQPAHPVEYLAEDLMDPWGSIQSIGRV